MEQESFLVRRDRLLTASTLVPADQRAAFFAKLFVGVDYLSPLEGGDTVVEKTASNDMSDAKSFPLTIGQARELKEKVDEATWAVVKAAAANVKDGVGTVDWSEVIKLTGVSKWGQFAQGRMGGLHRSLRKILGVPGNSVLLWEGDSEMWEPDGNGGYTSGPINIDGPAIHSVRAASGLTD